MPEQLLQGPLFLLIVSVLVLASILAKLGMQRLRLPPVVAYLFLGLTLRILDQRFTLLSPESAWTLDFLGELGVASLLFHVGLQSNLSGLLAMLPRALLVWTSDVVVSASVGFFTARWLGFGLLPALFVGVALSATSVGISVTVWEDAGAMQSKVGRLLLDVAELDDLSAIALLLVALAIAPALTGGGMDASIPSLVLGAIGSLSWKIALFAAGCWLFAAYIEKRLSEFFAKFRRAPDPLMVMVGFGFGIAALAGWLGFSVAVGALFAGLMFSRDPEAVRLERGFETVYSLFSPFFFINIGYGFDPAAIGSAVGVGAALLVAGVAGKFVGAGFPVVLREGWKSGAILGVSMIPRAEIALVAIQMGSDLGEAALPKELYGGMVLAAAAASILSPLLLHVLMERWPETVAVQSEAAP